MGNTQQQIKQCGFYKDILLAKTLIVDIGLLGNSVLLQYMELLLNGKLDNWETLN